MSENARKWIDELRRQTTKAEKALSDRMRTMIVGAVAVVWGLFTGQSAGVFSLHERSRILLLLGLLFCVLAIFCDLLEPFVAIKFFRSAGDSIDLGSDSIDEDEQVYSGRSVRFAFLRWYLVLAKYYLGLIGLGILVFVLSVTLARTTFNSKPQSNGSSAVQAPAGQTQK